MKKPDKEKLSVEKDKPEKNADGGFINALWNLLSSTRFAIILVAFIASVSLVGALVPQQPTQTDLKMMALKWGGTKVEAMRKIDLFDIYHSRWFRASLALLCVSIFVCSVDRLPKAVKLIKRRDPVPAGGDPERLRIRHKFYYKRARNDAVETTEKWLKRHRLRAVEETRGENHFFFINRGAYSRLGVYIVHASVIFIIIGAIIGNISGFQGRMFVLEKETVDSFYRLDKVNDWVTTGFGVRCDKFTFSIDPKTGMAGDYLSELAVIDGGKEVDRVKLRVNHPYIYKGVTLYQSSYELVDLEGATVKVFSRDGVEIGDVFLKGDQSSSELPGGGGMMRIVRAKSDDRTQTIAEVTVEIQSPDTGSVIMALKPGRRAAPEISPYKLQIAVRDFENNSPVTNFYLAEGEEKRIDQTTTIKLLDFNPAFPVHGKETAAAKILVTTAEGVKQHLLFDAFPDFDKMNLQGKYFYVLTDFRKEITNSAYSGPTYLMTDTDGRYKTILDVNHDPGVPVVYFGCVLIMIGLFTALFGSHRKIWIKIEPGRISMGGTVNRNRQSFENEFGKLSAELEKTLADKSNGGGK